MPTDPTVIFRPARPSRFDYTPTNLSGRYFPGWGLPCSLLFHQIPLLLAIFLSTLPTPPMPPPTPPAPPLVKSRPRIQWMYFPKLASVSPTTPPALPKSAADKPSPPAGSAAKGLVYPGPQEVVSDLPRPTNTIQTLLQPALKNAPILEPPLALPNLVLTADAGLAPPLVPLPPAPTPPKPAPAKPTPTAAEQPKATPPPAPAPKPEQPKVNVANLVTSAPLPLKPGQSPDMIVSPPPPAKVAQAEEPNRTEPAPQAGVASQGTDLETVVALSPMPASSEHPFRIPAGEARGHFAISPTPNLKGSETEPLSTAGSSSKPAVVGIETAATPAPSKPAAEPAGEPPASVSISFGAKSANKGEPSSPGKAGSGSGPTVAAAPARSAFAGISVTGGIDDGQPPAGARSVPQTRRPLQTSYGVSVISTESSGGGLPSFGLFSNSDIYTVYVDMREVEADSDPSWILEVATPQDPEPADGPKNISVRQGLVLPFPTVKKRPDLPPDLVRKHLRKMVIVYAVLNPEGKMEQMAIKQTPDPLLNEPVLASLSEWVFRPAVRNGIPFPVKILLGIPLWLRERAAPPRHVSISVVPPS